ncbi:MAG TPA: hypothetical protein VMR66_00270 [Gemmatimonadota bacterium]|nr:hypothetical protein [Gemmatimonadota bacterium]
MDDEVRKGPSEAETQEYEAPAIEEVLSPDDLSREVHYAGVVGSPAPG